MSQKNQKNNPYAPYPEWFEKWGDPLTLEKYPFEDIRSILIFNIKLYRKYKYDKMVEIICNECKREYISILPLRGVCPFCEAPVDYNINEMKEFLK